MRPVIIISTFPSKQSVTSIANQLVKKKLVACVNITKISSVYAWKGKIENLHPYDVPEIAEINVDSINQPYLEWLVDSTT